MKKTIKKVLDELAKDKPDLSYMRGLLEGLYDEEEKPIQYFHPPIPQVPTQPISASAEPLTSNEITMEELDKQGKIMRDMMAKDQTLITPVVQ